MHKLDEKISPSPDVIFDPLHESRSKKLWRQRPWTEPIGFCQFALFTLSLYALSAPLSIAISQIIVVSYILSWLLFLKNNRIASAPPCSSFPVLAVPMAFWLLIALIASLGGIEPLRSLNELMKTGFYMLLPFAVAHGLIGDHPSLPIFFKRMQILFLFFIFGQSTAALHTVIENGFGDFSSLKPPGAVTESGQLVMILPIFIALFFQLKPKTKKAHTAITQWFSAIAIFLLAITTGWSDIFFEARLTPQNQHALNISLLTALLLIIIFGIIDSKKKTALLKNGWDLSTSSFLLLSLGGLLFSAFLLNLKRGPWFGTFITMTVIGLFLSRKLAFSSVVLVGLLLFLSPAHDRIMRYADDFSISGGRQEMWELGWSLAERYPLGLGLDNASYMQKLDPTLPKLHRHMHNNFLNIAVEIGWLGLALYIWWMYVVIKLGFNLWLASKYQRSQTIKELGSTALILSSALLGWQIAGSVEYNFGDGEIRLIAFSLMGVLLAIHHYLLKDSPSPYIE